MYGYIYDVFLSQKSYDKGLIRIENNLTDLGLSGHTIKLSLINNIGHAVQDMVRRGIKTIVAVGSDQLFSKLVDQIDKLSNVTIGLIPLGSHQQLAKLFGIPEGAEGCRTLGARLICPVPLGKINNSYFIHSAVIHDSKAKVNCHDQFTVSATSEQAMISIYNLHESNSRAKTLSVVITPASEKQIFRRSQALSQTMIKSPKITIDEPVGIPIVIDGQKIINTPAKLEIVPETINVIMGKHRMIG